MDKLHKGHATCTAKPLRTPMADSGKKLMLLGSSSRRMFIERDEDAEFGGLQRSIVGQSTRAIQPNNRGNKFAYIVWSSAHLAQIKIYVCII